MTHIRLRPAHSEDELKKIYAVPHDHKKYEDHLLRVTATIAVAQWMIKGSVDSAADLSCGNGAILDALPADTKYYGDFASGYQFVGPIEKTIIELPKVDMFVCSETLEHLDDPDSVLHQIREKTTGLVLSTPIEAWNDTNPEHYHIWDRACVEEMLTAAGFRVVVYSTMDFRNNGPGFYCFGIWGCA